MNSTDHDKVFEQALEEAQEDYRDPYKEPWGDPERQTATQKKVWNQLHDNGIQRFGVVGGKGSAKAQPLDEPVLTPNGFVPMGEIEVGDKVIASDGTPTSVAAIHPQGTKNIYNVKFNDDTNVRATGDHIWRVRTGGMKHKGKGYERLRTTTELWNDCHTSQGYPKWEVPTVSPVEFPKRDLPVDPYVIGVLIAEGSFTTSGVKFATKDKEIIERIRSVGWTVENYKNDGVHWQIRSETTGLHQINAALRQYGLENKKSDAKFIPTPYLRSCVSDRLALLRGLMDGDGTVSKKRGTGEYCTVSRELAKDFCELIRSFGGKTNIKKSRTPSDLGRAFNINVNLDVNPFYLSRKAEHYNVDATQGNVKTISGFERLGEEEAQCITVTAEDGCYVTTNYTVTHNSHLAATWVLHLAQKYPNSTGCLVANSKSQARDSGGEKIVKIGNMLDYDVEYFRSKKIDGQQHSVFYAIDLDGEGINRGDTHMVLVRSMESIDNLEGTEIDYLYIEEIQDATKDGVTKAVTRNRGTGISSEDEKNPIMIAGMTESSLHWMYDLMEDGLGLAPEDEFDPDEDNGVLYEPTLFENEVNLGSGTIEEYQSMMDSQLAERHIHAKRTSSNQNRVLHEYRDEIHRAGRMSKLTAYYDPYRRLNVFIDFNIRPMSATLWQEKPWNDEWLSDKIWIEYAEDGTIEEVVEYDSNDPETREVVEVHDTLHDFAAPNREILAQVDEYEVWPDDDMGGGTEGLMRHVKHDYGERQKERLYINGDATGKRRDTRSRTNDWAIVQDYAVDFSCPTTVIPGLIASSDLTKGETTYDNPPRRDSINLLNRTLRDGNGRTHMCFLPESEYESGGAAASVASLERKPDGRIDDRPDKREGKEVRRTHLADCVRYAVWWWQDGSSPSTEQFNKMMNNIEQDFDGQSSSSLSFLNEDESNNRWF